MPALSCESGLRGKGLFFSVLFCGIVVDTYMASTAVSSASLLVEMELDLPLTQCMHSSGFKSAAR